MTGELDQVRAERDAARQTLAAVYADHARGVEALQATIRTLTAELDHANTQRAQAFGVITIVTDRLTELLQALHRWKDGPS